MRLFASQEPAVRSWFESIPTMHPVFAQLPGIAWVSYRGSRWQLWKIIGGIVRYGRIQALDAEVDLTHIETSHLETEVKLEYG